MTKRKSSNRHETEHSEIRMCVDVFPPEEDWERLADIACYEEPSNAIPGLAQAFAPGQILPVSIAFVTGKKWANGRTIKVAFMGGSSANQEFVVKIADQWPRYANLKFEWGATSSASDLRVAFQRGGAWSYMGTDNLGISKDRATMNLGWLDEAVVLHEFGHALGCIHEHQHPESGIPWDKAAVYRYYGGPPNNWDRATIDHNIFGTYGNNQTQFSAYDPSSIMHYAIDRALVTDPSFAVGWNKKLSGSDMKYAGEIYPKSVAPPPPPPGTTSVVDLRVDLARKVVTLPKGWKAES